MEKYFTNTFEFILAQIFGFVALILVCISYSFNNKKVFLLYQIASNIFYAMSFLTLGVLVGGFNTLISITRVTCLFFFEKADKTPPHFVYFIFALTYFISGSLFFQSTLDIMAIISYEIFNLAMFNKNISKVRFMMILPNFMIAIYNLLSMTYTNAILDFIEITVLIVSIIRFKNYEMKKIKFLI